MLQKKQENPTIDIAKIQIKSERLTPFWRLFSIIEQFDSTRVWVKMMRCFVENDVLFCWKRRVVLLKTTCCFVENDVLFLTYDGRNRKEQEES